MCGMVCARTYSARVPRRPDAARAPPHRGAGGRTSYAREEDVMDHADDPAAPTTMVPTSPQDLVQHLSAAMRAGSRRPCAGPSSRPAPPSSQR